MSKKYSLKGRNDFLIMEGMRMTYTDKDILVEDFFDTKGHPYALFDWNGNVLEANIDMSNKQGNALWYMYTRGMPMLLAGLEE